MPVTNASQRSTLYRLRDYHKEMFESFQRVIDAVEREKHGSSKRREGHTINDAIVIDAMRHAAARAKPLPPSPPRKVGRPPSNKPAPAYSAAAHKRKRLATEKFLATFDASEPRLSKDPRKIGVLVQHGYLEARDNGYVRTPKEFRP